jgi:hypothetical protein
MEHADFVFGLISSRACADTFPTRNVAEQFASGIRESRVRAGDDQGFRWVVKVGPWMYAFGIKPRTVAAQGSSSLSLKRRDDTGGAPAQ